MKKYLLPLIAMLFSACSPVEPEQVIVAITATPRQITATAVPASPTPSPLPTLTPAPTSTPAPRWDPIPISEVEDALRADGHRRYPWTTGGGLSAYTWNKETPYERVTTFEDGMIEIQVLHDKSQADRAKAVDRKFKVLDAVFQDGFMSSLRVADNLYNSNVRTSVSGEPDDVIAYNDDWNTVWAEYEAQDKTIGSYSVRFSLWWWQSTCPAQYTYCYYTDFPGLEFTGDSSFVFYTILLTPLESGDPSSQTT